MPDTQPAENAQVSLGLPPDDQICLVVRDLQAAVALYEPLFGPFTVLDNGPFESVYRGERVMVELLCAFGRTGALEIELIEWRSGPTPHRDFIQGGREGVQHIRYVIEDLMAGSPGLQGSATAPSGRVVSLSRRRHRRSAGVTSSVRVIR